MSSNEAEVDSIIFDLLKPKVDQSGYDWQKFRTIDLYQTGILDSYDVIELLSQVEEKVGCQPILPAESSEDLVLTVVMLVEFFCAEQINNGY